jgi:hypothetical protein
VWGSCFQKTIYSDLALTDLTKHTTELTTRRQNRKAQHNRTQKFILEHSKVHHHTTQ